MLQVSVRCLEARNACSEQVKLFRRTFGIWWWQKRQTVPVTTANILAAHHAGLDLLWFIEKFLCEEAQETYWGMVREANLDLDELSGGARVMKEAAILWEVIHKYRFRP